MFTDPSSNLQQLALGVGWHVADFGSGSGAYALAAAKRVGPDGRVYAVDVQKELLQKIKNEARTQRFSNIEIIWGNVEEYGGSKLRDNAMDAVIASNILFQIEKKDGFIKEIKRVLKPRGRVLIVDWTDSFGGLGPKQEAVVTEETAKKMFQDGGFEFEQSIQAGDHHYGVIFKKK